MKIKQLSLSLKGRGEARGILSPLEGESGNSYDCKAILEIPREGWFLVIINCLLEGCLHPNSKANLANLVGVNFSSSF
jgi:hypothetical protein